MEAAAPWEENTMNRTRFDRDYWWLAIVAVSAIALAACVDGSTLPPDEAGDGFETVVDAPDEPAADVVWSGDFVVRTAQDLAALRSYSVVGNRLTISATDLTEIDDLGELREVGALYITDNAALASVDGLSGLETVWGDLLIEDNPVLENVDGLGSLREVHGDLTVHSNPSLPDVDGMSGLESIGAGLFVDENPGLETLEGLVALTEINTTLFVRSNAGLSRLGMASLARVGQTLVIRNNSALPRCEVESLVAQLELEGEFAGSMVVFGNTGDAACE
jgi:hypothetical protein